MDNYRTITLYKSPLDMLGITLEEWKTLDCRSRTGYWDAFKRHVAQRSFYGLLNEYLKSLN